VKLSASNAASGNGRASAPPIEARFAHALAALREHRLAQVDALNLRVGASGDLDRHARGAGGHVDHAPRAGSRDVPHQLEPPAPVLAEGKQLGQEVVARRQRLEEIGREYILSARHLRSRHGYSVER
jgi:hypothetical protein